MISVSTKGTFDKTIKYLNKAKEGIKLAPFHRYGRKGVEALSNATPVRTGLTASSWSYEIVQNGDEVQLIFNNSNLNKGVNVALIIQLGHGTRNGGYVQGIDYVNPAMQHIFTSLLDEIWKELKGS